MNSYQFRVPDPQSDAERKADRIAWMRFGRDPKLCNGTNRYGLPCALHGGFAHDGRLYCLSHFQRAVERA